MNSIDIRTKPGAFRAARRPHPVSVEFAPAEGEMATLEGGVRYRAGDALLTGQDGERWPVPRERFAVLYEAVPGTNAGGAGQYRRRDGAVWAWRADRDLALALSDGRGTLHAKAGDVVVQFDWGDLAVMPATIFLQSYARIEN